MTGLEALVYCFIIFSLRVLEVFRQSTVGYSKFQREITLAFSGRCLKDKWIQKIVTAKELRHLGHWCVALLS